MTFFGGTNFAVAFGGPRSWPLFARIEGGVRFRRIYLFSSLSARTSFLPSPRPADVKQQFRSRKAADGMRRSSRSVKVTPRKKRETISSSAADSRARFKRYRIFDPGVESANLTREIFNFQLHTLYISPPINHRHVDLVHVHPMHRHTMPATCENFEHDVAFG